MERACPRIHPLRLLTDYTPLPGSCVMSSCDSRAGPSHWHAFKLSPPVLVASAFAAWFAHCPHGARLPTGGALSGFANSCGVLLLSLTPLSKLHIYPWATWSVGSAMVDTSW